MDRNQKLQERVKYLENKLSKGMKKITLEVIVIERIKVMNVPEDLGNQH